MPTILQIEEDEIDPDEMSYEVSHIDSQPSKFITNLINIIYLNSKCYNHIMLILLMIL